MFFLLCFLLFNKCMSSSECSNVLSNNDRRTNKTNLRLVQYNAEWLYIEHYSNFDCPGSQCSWKNTSEAEIHLNNIVNVINILKPDIINICEVESCDELNMVKSLLNDTSYISYLKKGTDTSTGQNVGMLTKVDPSIDLYRTEQRANYPIVGTTCNYNTSNNSSSGVSKHYITEFVISNINIAFISAHLIAIPLDPSRCVQREAQAQVLQFIIYEYIVKGYEVVMMGDFNDFDNEVLDTNNNVPLSSTLNILKGMAGESADLYLLTNVAQYINKTDRFTDWWDSDDNCATQSSTDYSMIDHILVTPKLVSKISNVFVYHGYDEYCGKYDSDHYPVVIDFVF